MSSTTTERTATAVSPDSPFYSVLIEAEQRVQQEAEEATRLAEERRIQREAQEADRAAEAARRKRQAEIDQFVKNAGFVVRKFHESVAKMAKQNKWQPAAIIEADAYCQALVLHGEDHELPTIDPTMAKMIHGKFAFGLALDRLGKNVIPDSFFVGQRQDWFPQIFALKLEDVSRLQHR